ncbi:hypothetical protein KC316_g6262 [Hortaea werneckii]|nr:hypothetical protein KC324_g3854 [Hortaea werneckii]KAI7585283.1 hypothetical protein KC316_g6262 [Hortaea werneckii]
MADMANMANVAGEVGLSHDLMLSQGLQSKINNEQLAISEGNALSARKATKKKDFQPFRFFELPREIRDCIYELVLLPKSPIDFAPLVRYKSYESFWNECTPYEDTHGWHFDHSRKVKATVLLLRANKQINSEATPIFYGQPFRFSNQSGWLILYHWMESIGGDKWDMVKDITICHPSFMTFPEVVYYARYEYGGLAFSLSISDLYYEERPWQPVKSNFKTYHEVGGCCGPEIDPVAAISRLPSLRNLRLILTCTQRADLWVNSPGLHPILDVNTPADLKIQAISLINYYYPYYCCPQPRDITDNIATEFGTISIAEAYADMRDKNVEITGMFYDRHGTFPVFPNMDCANKDLCDYLRNHGNYWDNEIVDGVCCGTKDERDEHTFAV